MRRRELISLLGGAAASSVSWPTVARAQQATMPVIGFLSARSPAESAYLVAGFREGLKESGYVEGQNVAIEYRWAKNQYDRLPALASELVRRPVAVIAAGGGDVSALAAKAATSTIPIVFTSGADPVRAGLVASFNRPGGNATGATLFTSALVGKRLELLLELVPAVAVVGALANPSNPNAESEIRDVQAAARALGRQLHVVNARNEGELEAAFATLVALRVGALFVVPDAVFTSRRDKLVEMAARHAVPAMYHFRELAETGGLMSYGVSFADAFRQVGMPAGFSRVRSRRVARHSADQVRAGHQPQDRQGARPHSTRQAAGARRRGD